ncbi:MAG: proline dehydrogenase family protein [Sulfobacillus sp.]
MSQPLLRRAILAAAESQNVAELVNRYGPKLGAFRFVAGNTLDETVPVVQELNRQQLHVTLDRLGEGEVDASYADSAKAAYLGILDRIAAEGLHSHVSLKLTQLGLDLDPTAAERRLLEIVERAGAQGSFVRVDMEDSRHTEATVQLFSRLRPGHPAVGIVIQAYLRRSEADLRKMAQLAANVRLVKGAYLEAEPVAFAQKADVDRNYQRLVEMHLDAGCFTAVATHDPALIASAQSYAKRHGIGNDRFEFQMLFGIRPDLQRQLVAEGYQVRVYVPFGPDWYPYFMRRLAERPANLGFFVKNLWRR